MTRAEIVDALETNPAGDALDAAVDELRKTCATCKNMQPCSRYECPLPLCIETDSHVPADGSGFCHRWEAKP